LVLISDPRLEFFPLLSNELAFDHLQLSKAFSFLSDMVLRYGDEGFYLLKVKLKQFLLMRGCTHSLF